MSNNATLCFLDKNKLWISFSFIPGDQPELSKCMMLLLLKYKRKLVGDGLELKRIAERLLILTDRL